MGAAELKEAHGGDLHIGCNADLSELCKYTGSFAKITICKQLPDSSPLPVDYSDIRVGASLLDLCDASLVQTKLLCALLDMRAPQQRIFNHCVISLPLFCAFITDCRQMFTGSDAFEPLSKRVTMCHIYGIETFLRKNGAKALLEFEQDILCLMRNTSVSFHTEDKQAAEIMGRFVYTTSHKNTAAITQPAFTLHDKSSMRGLKYDDHDVEQIICKQLR
jgi:hypothetical protein